MQTAQDPESLNKLILSHTPSVGRAFTSTRDGKWLYHCEGGTMAFIQANATNSNIDEDDYQDESKIKRVGTGTREVLVAKMILDPAADLEPGLLSDNPANLLYMACGRDGLWIMEADVDPTAANQAWCVDDSGNKDESTQFSRRWCSDVELCQVQGVDYLVAIFTKKGHSVLRVYPLAAVRAVATAGTGEIAALRQIILSSNGAAPAPPPQVNYTRPVAMALAIDQELDAESGQYANVYVAMGPHGLVCVTLKGDGAGGLKQPVKADGPVFGDSSAYDLDPFLAPEPGDASAGLYRNWITESDWKFVDPNQVVQRNEAPMFVDVVVYDGPEANDGPDVHQLFVAVDHLFWLVFDLNQPFGPAMPILHHEGDMWTFSTKRGSGPQPVVKPLDPTFGGIDEVSFARSLEIVNTATEGPLLLVTGSRRSILRDFMETAHEAIGFDEHLQPGRTWTEIPATSRTFVYKIKAAYLDLDFNTDGSFDEGGSGLHAPPTQDLVAAPYLAVFHSTFIVKSTGETSPAMSLTRMIHPWSVGGTVQTFRRPIQSHRGRMAFNIGHSILDPNLLLTSGNDAGLPQDGFVVMGHNPTSLNYEVKVYDQGGAFDRRGSGKILADAEMQWIDPLDPEAEYWWTSGKYLDPGGNPLNDVPGFKLLHIELKGGDAFSTVIANQPNQDWHAYLKPPLNRYGATGRVFYQAGCMNPDFDAFLGPGESRLFGTWQKSPEGLMVLDGEFAVEEMNANWFGIVDSDGWADDRMRLLVTHPEFNNMPWGNATLRKWWQGVLSGNKDLNDLVGAWPSKLIQLPGGSWILAVPCGQIHADPTWDIYDIDNNWLPPSGSIWDTGFTHGVVQFWEMKPDPNDGGRYWPEIVDPGLYGVGGLSPLKKIVVPDADTVIGTLESVTMTHNGSPETYLFCGDFGGRLYVYSITDIPTSMGVNVAVDSSKLVATWSSKANLFDDQPSEIFDIAIDYRGTDKALIYVTSPRVGVQILEFIVDPNPTTLNPTLTYQELIQSSGWTTGVDVRENIGGSRHLLVSENGGGFRVFEEAP